jgi:hypothetical protein
MKSEPGFQKRRVFGLICLAFLLSCSKPKPDEIVAQVDDISIKVGDIQKILRREGDIFENKSTRFSKPFLKAKE